MTLIQLQNKLSVEKWCASENAGRDLCGEYCFCSLCNKSENTPCAKAYNRAKAKKTTKKQFLENSLILVIIVSQTVVFFN